MKHKIFIEKETMWERGYAFDLNKKSEEFNLRLWKLDNPEAGLSITENLY